MILESHQPLSQIADQYKVATTIALDALYLFNPKHVPEGYWTSHGLKSIVGLPFLWRHCAGLSRAEVNRDIFGANAHFFALIKSYDDQIDDAISKGQRLTQEDLKANKFSKHELEKGIEHLLKTAPNKLLAHKYLN